MGDPKKIRKKYESPKRPWDKQRILKEKDLLDKYGLASKKEIRIMEAIISKKREAVKGLLALQSEVAEKGKKDLVNSLYRIGLVSKDATFTDILGLNVEDILERRLQTLVYRQGLASTIKQARQFIIHGFISINNRKINVPSYIVNTDEEKNIGYYQGIKPKILDLDVKKPELHNKKEIKEESTETENVEKSE